MSRFSAGRRAQHLDHVEQPALAEDRHDRRLGGDQLAQVGVRLGRVRAVPGHPECGQPGALPAHRAGGREELDVLGVRAGPAALDVRHPELVEHPRHAQLVGQRQRDVLALGAVAQGRVVQDDRASSVGVLLAARLVAHAGTPRDGRRAPRRPPSRTRSCRRRRARRSRSAGSARSAVRQPSSRARPTAASIASAASVAPERGPQQHRRRQDRADRVRRCRGRRCPAPSRGSARTARTCRARSGARRATPTAARRGSRPGPPPRRTGCRRTGSR